MLRVHSDKICIMESILPNNPLPSDILDYLYRISIWHEKNKGQKNPLVSWKKGIKKIKLINMHKLANFNMQTNSTPLNTLYLPSSYSAKDLLSQIRHALCHDDIEYDSNTEQIIIKKTNKVNIQGSFTFAGLQELVEAFLQPINI